ncbi:MAG: hypothetical protein JWP02_2886, partial [Acidimicrobiales bacterium]|nr:hypothetical protein [Acidimicrobiales bacterium]
MPTDALLNGLLILDLAAEPGRTAARILGDLGARVVRVPPAGRDDGLRGRVWDAGKEPAAAA